MDKYKTKFQNRESIYLIYRIILFPCLPSLDHPAYFPGTQPLLIPISLLSGIYIPHI